MKVCQSSSPASQSKNVFNPPNIGLPPNLDVKVEPPFIPTVVEEMETVHMAYDPHLESLIHLDIPEYLETTHMMEFDMMGENFNIFDLDKIDF